MKPQLELEPGGTGDGNRGQTTITLIRQRGLFPFSLQVLTMRKASCYCVAMGFSVTTCLPA